MSNIIKVKFLKDGQPSGRAYTYFSEKPVAVDEKVQINLQMVGVVTEINVPEEEIAPYKDKVKFIEGKIPEKQEPEEAPVEENGGNVMNERELIDAYKKNPNMIIGQLESCGYECEGGCLVNNVAFVALKELLLESVKEESNNER